MEMKCYVVEDLLPNYIEDVLSNDTKEDIKEHLDNCPECNQKYINMKSRELEEKINVDNKKEINYLGKYKKKMKCLKIFIVIALICVIFLGIFSWTLLMGWGADKTTSIAKYGEFENFSGYSQLEVFPEKISEEVKEASYYYYNRDTIFDPTCQIYLKCEYIEPDYLEEIERLEKISVEYNGDKNEIIYDLERFEYPAYVAMYNWSSSYEYAVVMDDVNTIVYVYVQDIRKRKIKFDVNLLPGDYMEDTTYGGDSYENFSIYSFNGYWIGL